MTRPRPPLIPAAALRPQALGLRQQSTQAHFARRARPADQCGAQSGSKSLAAKIKFPEEARSDTG